MKKKALLLCLCALGVASAMMLSACDKNKVAATVNGEDLMEQTITDYIESYRVYAGLEDDADWATFLVDNGYTVADLRESVINYYAGRMAVEQKAAELGITVDDASVQEQIDSIRSLYGYTEDADWNSALESMGYTADGYFADIKYSLLEEALSAKAEAVTLDDATCEEYASMYGSGYESRNSSQILVESEDEANAILKDLQAKLASDPEGFAAYFASIASAKNTDGTKSKNGEVGWDINQTFVSEYSTALSALSKGEISDVVKSEYGYHIIYCTDIFPGEDGDSSYAKMPDEVKSVFTEDLQSYLDGLAADEYIATIQESADVQIKDMPSGLSYDVDLSLATSEDSSSTESSSSTDTSASTEE